MSEIMLDLETLGVIPNSVILVIGAIKFNSTDDICPLENMNTFYRLVDIDSSKKIGATIDKNTIQWWKTQPADVQYEAFDNPNRVNIRTALSELTNWVGNCDKVWANSPDFDCVILAENYRMCGMNIPWKYWMTRDTRTLFDIMRVKVDDLPNNSKHHALHDCYRQLVGVQKAFRRIPK